MDISSSLSPFLHLCLFSFDVGNPNDSIIIFCFILLCTVDSKEHQQYYYTQ